MCSKSPAGISSLRGLQEGRPPALPTPVVPTGLHTSDSLNASSSLRMKWVKLKSPFFLDLRKQNRPELKPLRHTQSKWPCLTPSSWWFSMALASRGRVSCASSLRPFIQLLGNYGILYTEADSKRGTELRRESRTNCLRKRRNKVQRLQRNELWEGTAAMTVKAHRTKQKLS